MECCLSAASMRDEQNEAQAITCVQVGDKLVQVSASFGDDVWDAGKFGQCMYAIKTRNGDLYFRFKKMYGDLSSFDVSPSPHSSLLDIPKGTRSFMSFPISTEICSHHRFAKVEN